MSVILRKLTRIVRNPIGGWSGQPAIIRPSENPHRFDQYCFIAGLHRSGTTLMEQLLAAHCEVAVLRADVPENEGQHLQDVVPAARDRGGPGRFAFSPDMHTAPVSGADADYQRDRLLRCWSTWATNSSGTLLEKSPPNLVRIPWLRSVFPGARFLIMMRDPRVAAAATQKWTPGSLDEMVHHWHVAYAAAAAALGDDCVVLRYEDMCEDLDASLSKTIAALGLKRRAQPLPVAERFSTIRNSNAKYLDTLSPRHWGPGIWDEFGYDLGHSC